MPKLIALHEVAIDAGEHVEILRAREERERRRRRLAGSIEHAIKSRAARSSLAAGTETG